MSRLATRRVGLGLLAVVASLLSAMEGRAAELSFVPSTAEVRCDEQVEVDLVVDAAAFDLRGYSIVLEFDPSLVDLVSVQPGALLTGASCPHFFQWLNSTAVGDSIAFDGASLGCSVSGPGSLATLTFEGLIDGMAPLDFRSLRMRTGLNLPIPTTTVPGTLLVSCPVATETTRWGAWKARYD